MKQHRNVTARQEALSERNLFAAVLTLKNVDECRAFFRDLCTPAELQAIADRWAVVEWLQKGLPYREIHRITGVTHAATGTLTGSTTIVRDGCDRLMPQRVRPAAQCSTSITTREGAVRRNTRKPVLRRNPSPNVTTPSKSPASLRRWSLS